VPFMKSKRLLFAGLLLLTVALLGNGCPLGLNQEAFSELEDAGVFDYMGEFTPISSVDVGNGWTKHTFDTEGGDGPICIVGTPYSVYTRQGNPTKLVIFEQGGGACWQDFYFCNPTAEAQAPENAVPAGFNDLENPDNPFADYSIVYMPYCDGSVFSGDNDVVDPNFPFGPVRFHRGLRNQSAGMDVAKAEFPYAHKITVAGHSAGGVGVAGFAPFLARYNYGNFAQLTVFNDAGPVAANLDDTVAIAARAADWEFGQFYPVSCTECDDMGQSTPIIDWRLNNDNTIREAFYSTDGDATDRFFLGIPTQEEYRELIVTEHGLLNAAHPYRYKAFILSGDDEHGAIQRPDFYTAEIDGVFLSDWTSDFVKRLPFWQHIVQDFIPIP